MLGVNGATNSKGRVELYERGYGKDAAGIAKEAITYGKRTPFVRLHFCLTLIFAARDNDFDVVLIDTAGRMQDNEVCCILDLASPVPSCSSSDSLSCAHSPRWASSRNELFVCHLTSFAARRREQPGQDHLRRRGPGRQRGRRPADEVRSRPTRLLGVLGW